MVVTIGIMGGLLVVAGIAVVCLLYHSKIMAMINDVRTEVAHVGGSLEGHAAAVNAKSSAVPASPAASPPK